MLVVEGGFDESLNRHMASDIICPMPCAILLLEMLSTHQNIAPTASLFLEDGQRSFCLPKSWPVVRVFNKVIHNLFTATFMFHEPIAVLMPTVPADISGSQRTRPTRFGMLDLIFSIY
ncbi:MAG: hypothetical protein BGO12_08385 [Verrucomicrobia bacterium 61-8]|nr:MAG: hypothetical protein BGO12_08385 [Verrucomicrobia bacterium 61-8]